MFSYVCAAIASYHNAQAVLIAAGITALVTFSVSMFAIQTKIDFTMCYGLIFAASMTLFFLGIAFIIVYAAIPGGENGKNYYVSRTDSVIIRNVLSNLVFGDYSLMTLIAYAGTMECT